MMINLIEHKDMVESLYETLNWNNFTKNIGTKFVFGIEYLL